MKPEIQTSTVLDKYRDCQRIWIRVEPWLSKPQGLLVHILFMALILVLPCWLFGLARLPAWVLPEARISTIVHQNLNYRLHSDDFAYIGSSRTWPRTLENLLVPHNTHICPSWRILNWCVTQIAGDLIHLPNVMKFVSYLALVLVMLQVGHFVAHESQSMTIGYCASVLVGITSIQRTSTMWYSAGQTLWAGLFVLNALIFAQESLRRKWNWLWIPVIICCWIAGGFWTIGHASGPITAIYILAVTSGRKRLLALIPFLATLIAVIASLAISGNEIDPTISFHGRSTKEALDIIQGISHTCHSIIETLVLGNLGIHTSTTNTQAMLLTLALAVSWFIWHLRNQKPITTLEWTGAALCISAYWVEWSFRGYFSWDNLKGLVNWYDSIPQIGWVIFLSGWAQASVGIAAVRIERSTIGKIWITRGGFLVVVSLILTMMTLNQAEVDRQLLEATPRQIPFEIDQRIAPTPEMKRLRANYIWDERAKRQYRHLARLQDAEKVAKGKGWGLLDISAALGRIQLPEIPKVYDAINMMDLPKKSKFLADPSEIRRTLGKLLALEPEKRPEWMRMAPDIWPPKGDETE